MTCLGSIDLQACRFFDIHYHASPDLYHRRYTALQAGHHYQQQKGAVVLKSHLGATSVQASLAQNEGLPVFPSVALNAIAGGIDYRVVLRALAEYQSTAKIKMVVDFPTITGRHYTSRLTRQLANDRLQEMTTRPLTLFDESNRLKKEVIDVLKMAKDYPIVVSTGHASKEEVEELINACIGYAVPALLLNQPANPLTGLDASQLKILAAYDFVWIEQTALTYLLGHQTKADLSCVLQELPRVIYSSDLGQTSQMDIAQWLHFSQQLFAELDLCPKKVAKLCKDHAIELLSE